MKGIRLSLEEFNNENPEGDCNYKEEIESIYNGKYQFILIENKENEIIKLKDNTCNNEFFISFKRCKKGKINCPWCEIIHKKRKLTLEKQQVNERFKTHNMEDYKVVGDYFGMNYYTIIKHLTCGNIFEAKPNSVVQGASTCLICRNKLKRDKVAIINKEKTMNETNGEYEMIGEYKGYTGRTEFLHKQCNLTFKTSPEFFFLRKYRCPHCEENSSKRRWTEERFKKYLENRTNGEYELDSIFTDLQHKVYLHHNKCNKRFLILPANYVRNGHRCPYCNNSLGECKIQTYLDKEHIDYKPQYSFDGCYNEKLLKFDFCIMKDNKVSFLVEYQGIQHYEAVEFFGGDKTLEKNILRDGIKDEFCKENNIPLLKISYEDFKLIDKILSDYILKNY